MCEQVRCQPRGMSLCHNNPEHCDVRPVAATLTGSLQDDRRAHPHIPAAAFRQAALIAHSKSVRFTAYPIADSGSSSLSRGSIFAALLPENDIHMESFGT